MNKLLQTLTEASGPSGYEDKVREVVRREIKPLADEIRVDALGNLIARKGPGGTVKTARKIMIAAHLDEAGVMVSHVDENGFVRFSPIGHMPRKYLLGSRLRFLNGVQGVIESEHPGNDELPGLDKLYIDVGATNRNDCPMKVGDLAVFDCSYYEQGHRLVARSLDSRAGVWVAVETLRSLKSVLYDVYFVFTAQQQVGMRGALTSAYGIDPDIGIALDTTSAGDMPGCPRGEMALGKGPCIQMQTGSMIADTQVVDWMIRAAEKNKIPYQREVSSAGSSAARMIQLVRAGVPAGCISIPVRYAHSSSEIVDTLDLQNAVKLLTALLRTRIEL